MDKDKYFYLLEISDSFISLPKQKISRKKYIDIPYSEKDEVKDDGAYWDPISKRWYIPDNDAFLVYRMV